MPRGQWLRAAEAASYARLSEWKIKHLAQRGQIPAGDRATQLHQSHHETIASLEGSRPR